MVVADVTRSAPGEPSGAALAAMFRSAAAATSTGRRGTPPGARSNRRQVSWLAARRPSMGSVPVHAFPGQPQWPKWFGLAAYSCGGSCGIGIRVVAGCRTAFPVGSLARDRRSSPLNGRRTGFVNAIVVRVVPRQAASRWGNGPACPSLNTAAGRPVTPSYACWRIWRQYHVAARTGAIPFQSKQTCLNFRARQQCLRPKLKRRQALMRGAFICA